MLCEKQAGRLKRCPRPLSPHSIQHSACSLPHSCVHSALLGVWHRANHLTHHPHLPTFLNTIPYITPSLPYNPPVPPTARHPADPAQRAYPGLAG